MDFERRQKHVQDTRERIIAEQEAHVDSLSRLGEEYCIDLDVFTDIYGLEALDRSDTSVNTVASWTTLVDGLRSGASLVVIVAHYPMQQALISTGRQRTVKYATRFTVIDMDGEHTITSSKQSAESPSSFQLTDVNTLTLETNSNICGSQEWARGDLLLAKPHTIEGFRAMSNDKLFHFVDGTMNPTTGLGVGVVGLRNGDDIYEIFSGLAHKDENVVFGLHRLEEELDRIFT